MTSTNAPIFNRHSSNIIEDNGIAIYDVAPLVPSGGKKSKLRTGQTTISRHSADLKPEQSDFVPSDFSFYTLQCNHGISTTPGYYLYNWDNPIVSLPTTTGLPLNYGVPNRVRYRVDSEDFIGEQPIILLPSYGMGSNIFSRAKAFEMWFNLEPFSRARAENLFPREVKNLELTSPPCTVTGSCTSVDVGHVDFNSAGSLEWDVPFLLIGGTKYEFSIDVDPDSTATITASLILDLGTTQRIFPAVFTVSGGETKLTQEFNVEQGFDLVTAKFKIQVSAPCILKVPTLHDKDRPAAGMSIPYRIIQFGNEKGTTVVVSADAEFMYLEGYGQEDSYQISEWARPMLLVCNEYGDKFSVFVNGTEILSIDKDPDGMDTLYGDINGNHILISIGAMFKYIDISTMAFYSEPLAPQIQELHKICSFGVQWSEIAPRTHNDQIYIADGASTSFSAKILFPTMVDFLSGYGSGLRIDSALTLPDYKIPPVQDGDLSDIVVVNNDETTDADFASRYFYLDNIAEMEFNIDTIGVPIDYLFVGISPFDIPTTSSILKVWSPEVKDIWCTIDMVDLGDGNLRINAILNYNDSLSYLALTPKIIKPLAGPPLFWSVVTPKKDFTLMLNLKKFIDHVNGDVVRLFSDPKVTFTATSSTPYRFIALSSEEIGRVSRLSLTDIPHLSIDDQNRTIIGNTNYALYAGSATEVDVAATGFWYISIPLLNLAAFNNGIPDLDYVLYFDQNQSPQLVSSNESSRTSYSQITQTVSSELKARTGQVTIGEYSDMSDYAYDNNWKYGDVGITSTSSALELGRFANTSLSTFVTLDSPSRWPSKKYWDLEPVYATTVPFIDFEDSTRSVVDTKWEIFDGYAIRFPKNLIFQKYYLGIGVQLKSMSLKKRLSFRYMDLYGLSNREYASNLLDVGGGSKILIGNELRVNTNYKYSAYISPAISPSTYMTRENGFYPHNELDGQVQYPITFKLAEASKLKSISFYMYWRADKFRSTPDSSGVFQENIATIAYRDENNIEYKQYVNIETDGSVSLGYRIGHIGVNRIGFAAFGTEFYQDYDKIRGPISVYVDGELDDRIEAGRWHMIFIDLTDNATEMLMDTDHSVRFILNNNKCVMNYITSHSDYINPKNLMCARFGFSDNAYFSFDHNDNDMFYDDGVITEPETPQTTVSENYPLKILDGGKITYVGTINEPGNSGVEPNVIVRINNEDVTL